jgi:8-oxo-dGTP pyrophosphatase MutT (NUDIX family)
VTTADDTGYGRVLPRKRAAATMLLTDQSGRVAVVKPTYKPLHELPGGAVEDGESPRQAARREIAEELHLHREPGRLLALDYVPAASSSAGTEGLVVVFDGGVVTNPDALRVPADELAELAFVGRHELDRYLPPLQARRAAAALQARAESRTIYLEDGRDPSAI